MPSEICGMVKMDIQRINNGQNVIVALKNGQIRMYNEKNLINIL
jgi:hypothetical protein